MNRTELFDKLLQKRFENPNGFLSMLTLSEQKFGVTDENMIESIVDEMIENNWAEPTNYSKFDVMIKYDGQQLIEKYGSYSSFLVSENEAQKKAQRSKITPEVIKIGIAIIFGLSTALLGWLNFIDKNTIENQKNEIELLNNKIDSLTTKAK